MAEKELSSEEVEAFKKELAEIKADMMRKELEEIKKERMRKELDEIRAERAARAQPQTYYAPARKVELSLLNILAAALSLLAAGYLVGTLYGIDLVAAIDDFIKGYALPLGGSAMVIALAVALTLVGIGLIALVRNSRR